MKNLTSIPRLSVDETKTTRYFELPGLSPDLVTLEVIEVSKTEKGETSKNVSLSLSTNITFFKNHCRPVFAPEDFLEKIKTENPFADVSNNIWRKLPWNFEEHQLENYLKNCRIILVSISSHTLLNLDLSPISYCHHFDYIGTPFTNDVINLNKEFLKFLKNHPWVVNKNSLKIEDIEYYNRSSERYQFVPIDVYVDDETLKEIYEETFPGGDFSEYKDIKSYICSENYSHNKTKYKDWFGIEPFLKGSR
jgi:hypothetical protein